MIKPNIISLVGFWTLATLSLANTEKAIFKAPASKNILPRSPTPESLGLEGLTPDYSSLRTRVNASFPDHTSPQGATTWLMLQNLTANQRYEVRISWSATHPTSFTLDTFELDRVLEAPELANSLAGYSRGRQLVEPDAMEWSRPGPPLDLQEDKSETRSSILFLRIMAAADYFSDREEHMARVEPVSVDIVLDPYLCNVLPRSLVPTAAYIIATLGLAFIVSRYVRSCIHESSPALMVASKKKI